jgi:UDP-hydrolysing UDP-N-acetyl-D-glucosamine 2-epimerase
LSRPRKVCVVVASRANYARIKSVLAAVRDREDLELQIVAAASTLLERFGSSVAVMRKDGFEPDATVRLIIEGENPATMAKSTGLGLLELPTIFELLAPDVVVTVADRFETIAAAVAAAYMNLPVAHTQGGEVSGSIDESVRHAVTKLAHMHFPATELSARRVIALGENPEMVFKVGCPSIDLVEQTNLALGPHELELFGGVGSTIEPQKPFLLVIQHPVTTEYGRGYDQINQTLEAVGALGLQTLVFWPNVDAGYEEVAKGIRHFREQGRDDGFHFFRNLTAETFIKLMANCACMVGNSSAALREGSFLGTPAVTIGSRQRGRECGMNVVHVDHDAAAIADAVRDQVRHGRYERDDLFGDGTAGARIAEVLSRERPRVQKRLHHAYPDPREFDAFRVREEPEPVPRMADGNGAGAEPLSSRDSPR